jgi:hypothetical protein
MNQDWDKFFNLEENMVQARPICDEEIKMWLKPSKQTESLNKQPNFLLS